jgi:hypothetical protein
MLAGCLFIRVDCMLRGSGVVNVDISSVFNGIVSGFLILYQLARLKISVGKNTVYAERFAVMAGFCIINFAIVLT